MQTELARFSDAAQVCGLGVWFTPHGGRTVWNGAARALLKLGRNPEVPIEDVWQAIDVEDVSRVRLVVEQSAYSGEPFVVSFRTHADPVSFLRASGYAVLDKGRLVLTEGFVLDETSRVQAQARLAIVVDTTPALLWVMDPAGFCSFFSQSWYDFTGQTPEDALGLGWLKTVHPEDIPVAAAHAKQAAIGRSAFESIHRLRHHSGNWRWVLCVGKPRFSSEGRFLGHSGAVTDIHERIQAECAHGPSFCAMASGHLQLSTITSAC